MKIEKGKVLTISATEYCQMMGKDLNQYVPFGVHGKPTNLHVPDDTVVVVGYRSHIEYFDGQQGVKGVGTALVLKDKTDLEHTVEEQNG